MSAYFLFDNIEVIDPEGLSTYVKNVAPVVEKYGGTYRVKGGESQKLEGDWAPAYPVLIEFENKERALKWYHSDDYRDLKLLRQKSVKCNGTLIDGGAA